MQSELEKVVEEINEQAEVFRLNAAQTTNKSAAARARKATSALRDLGKVYRKLSIKQ